MPDPRFDSLMRITDRPPVVFVRGQGSWLWDSEGGQYLDFVQGWAVNCLGHAPPVVAQAISAQAALLINASPVFYNDLTAVEAAITERTVVVMVEPIQGEAGVVPAADGYLAGLRRLTRERGILLILDEIQTGMGRTGKLFAYQHAGFLPDILTLGKGIGGGAPLAALLAREEI